MKKKLIIILSIILLLIALCIGGVLVYRYYIYDYERDILKILDEYFEKEEYKSVGELKNVLKTYKNSNKINDIKNIAYNKIELIIEEFNDSEFGSKEEFEKEREKLIANIDDLYELCCTEGECLLKENKYEKLIELVNSEMKISEELIDSNEDLVAKTVPVKALFKGDLLTGYSIANYMIEVDSVIVRGMPDTIEDIEFVELIVDVEGLGQENGVEVLGEVKKLDHVYVVKEKINVILDFDTSISETFSYNNILIKNLDKGLSAVATNPNDFNVNIEVVGTSDVLADIDISDITPYIDLTGYTTGVYSVTVLVDSTDSRVQCISTKKIEIKIV